MLERVAFPFARASSQPRDQTQVSRIAGGFFTTEPQGKPMNTGVGSLSRRSSWPRNWTWVSCIAGVFFIGWATREALSICNWVLYHRSSTLAYALSQRRDACSFLYSLALLCKTLASGIQYIISVEDGKGGRRDLSQKRPPGHLLVGE